MVLPETIPKEWSINLGNKLLLLLSTSCEGLRKTMPEFPECVCDNSRWFCCSCGWSKPVGYPKLSENSIVPEAKSWSRNAAAHRRHHHIFVGECKSQHPKMDHFIVNQTWVETVKHINWQTQTIPKVAKQFSTKYKPYVQMVHSQCLAQISILIPVVLKPAGLGCEDRVEYMRMFVQACHQVVRNHNTLSAMLAHPK